MTASHDKARAERWAHNDRLEAAHEGVVAALEALVGVGSPDSQHFDENDTDERNPLLGIIMGHDCLGTGSTWPKNCECTQAATIVRAARRALKELREAMNELA